MLCYPGVVYIERRKENIEMPTQHTSKHSVVAIQPINIKACTSFVLFHSSYNCRICPAMLSFKCLVISTTIVLRIVHGLDRDEADSTKNENCSHYLSELPRNISNECPPWHVRSNNGSGCVEGPYLHFLVYFIRNKSALARDLLLHDDIRRKFTDSKGCHWELPPID